MPDASAAGAKDGGDDVGSSRPSGDGSGGCPRAEEEPPATSPHDGQAYLHSFLDELPHLYRTASEIDADMHKEEWGLLRRKLDAIVSHHRFDVGIGVVILVNMVGMSLDASASAEAYPLPHENHALIWMNRIILLIYTAEAIFRAFILRSTYLRDRFCILDVIIVIGGWFDESYSIFMAMKADEEIPVMRMLPMMRILRLLRLGRVLRLVRFHPELRVMVMGFFGAVKAMTWGFILILALIFFWSMVFLELISPVTFELLEHEPDALSPFCQQSFRSTLHAGWMLFQTLVAGDSWGDCTLPIVEYQAWTFFVFAIAVVSVTLGMMNLILSVIVDKAAHAREGDRDEKIREKKVAERQMILMWKHMIEEIDENGDHKITMEEMMKGYEMPKVRDNLNLLGIAKDDLDSMFKLMDKDKSGDLDYKEFLSMFHKAQGQDLRIYLMMMHLQNTKMGHHIDSLKEGMARLEAKRDKTGSESKAGSSNKASI